MQYKNISKQIIRPFNTILKLTLIFLLTSCFTELSIAQSYSDLESYIIAKKQDGDVYLFTKNQGSLQWVEIGNTNRTDIQSISTHPTNNTIYAVSNGALGILDKTNGSFNSIGVIGNGDGELGNITFDNIYGLTHSFTEEALFASHRTDDNLNPDVLIKIDAATGMLIEGSFEGYRSGNIDDYTILEPYEINIPGYVEYATVADISVDPYNDQLIVVYNDHLQNESIVAISNTYNGEVDFFAGTTLSIATGVCFDYFESVPFIAPFPAYIVTENPNISNDSNLWWMQDDVNGANLIEGGAELPYLVLGFDYLKKNCVADLTIEKNYLDFPIFPNQESSNSIITESITGSPGYDVTIYAETIANFKSNYITLQPGFKVVEGACFNAIIEPCEP